MKITIELTDAEVKGIKDYLKDLDVTDRPGKSDIQQEIAGRVYASLHSPGEAVSDYISKHENR